MSEENMKNSETQFARDERGWHQEGGKTQMHFMFLFFLKTQVFHLRKREIGHYGDLFVLGDEVHLLSKSGRFRQFSEERVV